MRASRLEQHFYCPPLLSGAIIELAMISRAITEQMERSSWIRHMFEIGIQLRKERGAENVFDFTLGNPEVEPPEAVVAALRRVVAEKQSHSHGYMPNAGFPEEIGRASCRE